MEVVASLSQGRTAASQCGLFTYKSVPVILEPPCILDSQFGPDSYPTTMPDTDPVIFSKTRGWFQVFF